MCQIAENIDLICKKLFFFYDDVCFYHVGRYFTFDDSRIDMVVQQILMRIIPSCCFQQ